MKALLEADLGTGLLYVTRNAVDYAARSYAWSITFNMFGDIYGEDHSVTAAETPPLVADATGLRGAGAAVEVTVVNTVPPSVRGVTHVFTRRGSPTAGSTTTRSTGACGASRRTSSPR